MVTGERRGDVWVSLFHVSADMRWSDLPMSGSFVEMLRRIVDSSGYTLHTPRAPPGDANVETVAPLRTLDGFGAFDRRPRRRSHCPPTSGIGRHRIIRPASMARPTVRSR